MARRPAMLLILSLLTGILLLAGSCGTPAQRRATVQPAAPQPSPAVPGVPAPAIEATYRAAQADPSLSDEAKVKAAVDAYFTLKYEGIVRSEALDLGFVVDLSSESGRAVHDYELGRLRFMLLNWQGGRSTFVAYDYRPNYEAVAVAGGTATVRVRPKADMHVTTAGAPHVEPMGDDPHVLTLTGGPQGWRVSVDDYRDELKRGYPLGTDWDKVIAEFPKR